MDYADKPEPEIDPEFWGTLRRCSFVRKVFAAYPSLRSIEPAAWDNDKDEVGYYCSAPYTGQEFDPAEFEVVEGGWDHEHCGVCK